jgi:hypothetical protein
MPKGLLLFLDDIAVMARATAASLDDVAVLTGKAGMKAAGVVVDDAAVTPGYVVGLRAERELPVVWKIALGSLRNKMLFLLPAALALSAVAPWAMTPLLIAGGGFLCFEGVEKVLAAVRRRPAAASLPDERREPADPAALEEARVKGAVTTDFILSAEIMAITLDSVSEQTASLPKQAAVLAAVSLSITVLVYGTVALLVKGDDVGLRLLRAGSRGLRALGRAVVRSVPGLLRALGVVGTAAMLWVGGDILIHGAARLGAAGPEHGIAGVADDVASALPPIAGLASWLVRASCAATVGALVGALVVFAKAAWWKAAGGAGRSRARA